jgi:hypothetical protein
MVTLRISMNWTLSIVRYSLGHNRTHRFGNWICFRPQMRWWETSTLLGSLERVDLHPWTTYMSV